MAEIELRRANREVAAAAAELHFAATHDTLTRLHNRRALLEDLGQLLAERRPATFALLDLHGMRGFNDAHGHIAGDELLASLGARLETALMGHGHVYRLGGVQLCALLMSGAEDAVRVACAALTTTDDRLPRRDRRAAAGGAQRRRRPAPRGRAAGRLRACCDRWRLTSRSDAPARGPAGGRRRSPASTRPAS